MSATSNMKTPESEVVHELVERIGQRIADLTRQMGVDQMCSCTFNLLCAAECYVELLR